MVVEDDVFALPQSKMGLSRTGQLALLRLDGDLYESTMDALKALYEKVSPGGFVIVDDFNDFEPCGRAVLEFRELHDIKDPIVTIDWTGAFWRKSGR
jgi:O-methyltransferase